MTKPIKTDPVRKALTDKEMKFVELYVDNYFSQKMSLNEIISEETQL